MEKKTKILIGAGVAGLVALGMMSKGSSETTTGTGGSGVGGIAPFADMLQFGGTGGSKKDVSVDPVGGTGGHTINLPAMAPMTFGGGGWGESTPTYTPKMKGTPSEGWGRAEYIDLYNLSLGVPKAFRGQRPVSESKKSQSAPSPSVVRKADPYSVGQRGGSWFRSGATKGIKKSWAAHQEKRQFQWGFLKGAAGR